ncbi:MAG: glycosyltransferase family 4 protein [Thermoproteales archaeon]|nr:glycosyltransferase family 4 protein [Thermoproteales archaeon]
MGKIKDKELPAVYNNADLFVLPSLYGESFGIVVLEAMASGVPVIVSNIGGLKEIVNNPVDGILLEKNDPKEIYEKIMMLYKNPDLRRYLSKNARRKVEEKYDWNKIICNIEKLYMEILEEKKYPLLYSKNK